MIYKQYEKPHEHYLFQWERGSKNYGIYTTDVEIAKIIRRRNNTYEFDVIFPIGCGSRKFWLFSTNYATYQSARKSFNRLLTQHSYRKLKYNSVNDEYESISYTDCTLEKGSEGMINE